MLSLPACLRVCLCACCVSVLLSGLGGCIGCIAFCNQPVPEPHSDRWLGIVAGTCINLVLTVYSPGKGGLGIQGSDQDMQVAPTSERGRTETRPHRNEAAPKTTHPVASPTAPITRSFSSSSCECHCHARTGFSSGVGAGAAVLEVQGQPANEHAC